MNALMCDHSNEIYGALSCGNVCYGYWVWFKLLLKKQQQSGLDTVAKESYLNSLFKKALSPMDETYIALNVICCQCVSLRFWRC